MLRDEHQSLYNELHQLSWVLVSILVHLLLQYEVCYFPVIHFVQISVPFGFFCVQPLFMIIFEKILILCSFFFFSLSLPKASLTSKDFSFTLQYYMHARHLALSRTFPDKFEMEPCAPPKVKSAFRDEFICVFSYFTERRKGICVCERKRVSKVLLNNREVNSQLKPLFIDPSSNQNL